MRAISPSSGSSKAGGNGAPGVVRLLRFT
jgi:hypothetical protein